MRGATDHLVIVSDRTLGKLRRQRPPVLVWARRRREPPVGAVERGDTLFFKRPGGDVRACAQVARVTEGASAGRYRVRMRLARLTTLPVPIPIVKRDRRSWVVCREALSERQQPLFTPPGLTLEHLAGAVRRLHPVLPGRRTIERGMHALLATGLDPTRDLGVLVVLVTLLALKSGASLTEQAKRILRGGPSRVHPLAVFRKRAR